MFYKNGKYYLVSQQIIFGLDIYILEANTAVGRWTNKRTLYHIPDQYRVDFISYNSFVHHALSREGELVISYNIIPLIFPPTLTVPVVPTGTGRILRGCLIGSSSISTPQP
jgi:Domain of unknown function (DUF5005)